MAIAKLANGIDEFHVTIHVRACVRRGYNYLIGDSQRNGTTFFELCKLK